MRALLIVLDSVGVGDAGDAAAYGDAGANTLGHIFEQQPDLSLPNLCSLGLTRILPVCGANETRRPIASYGRMQERSAGKDTTTGHWEIAGAVLDEAFAVFERFPDDLVQRIEQDAGVEFIGNYASSGTTVIEQLGAQHLQTGKPILYTSADSVLQIAAHEEVIPIERLYAICEVARKHADDAQIGRVIARPFLGQPGNFKRTPRRHDYSMKPPRTILDAISEAGVPVIGVGKISDIFAGQGVTESYPTASNAEGMAKIARLWDQDREGLLFANLVDFDMHFGHRRDVAGYAQALEEFDAWLGSFLANILPEDLVIITADHGNDPTFRGTDHTREQVPLLVLDGSDSRDLGVRQTFADVAATLAEHFRVTDWRTVTSFLNRVAA